jgi:hypothetical protein
MSTFDSIKSLLPEILSDIVKGICCRFAGLLVAEVHFIYRGNVTAQA